MFTHTHTNTPCHVELAGSWIQVFCWRKLILVETAARFSLWSPDNTTTNHVTTPNQTDGLSLRLQNICKWTKKIQCFHVCSSGPAKKKTKVLKCFLPTHILKGTTVEVFPSNCTHLWVQTFWLCVEFPSVNFCSLWNFNLVVPVTLAPSSSLTIQPKTSVTPCSLTSICPYFKHGLLLLCFSPSFPSFSLSVTFPVTPLPLAACPLERRWEMSCVWRLRSRCGIIFMYQIQTDLNRHWLLKACHIF